MIAVVSSKKIQTLVLSFLFVLGYQLAWATGEVSYAEGEIEATYEESTDSQSKKLSGPNRMVSYRSHGMLSFLDLGVELGTYSLSGKSSLHDVKLSSDYINLIAGLSFRFYPNWLEYTLDLGYRLSVDRLNLDQSDSSGKVTEHKVGSIRQQPFSQIGIRAFVGGSLYLGLDYEQQEQLFTKSSAGLNPEVKSAESIYLTFGYRFGQSGEVTLPRKVSPGPTNYNDPCRLFKACN